MLKIESMVSPDYGNTKCTYHDTMALAADGKSLRGGKGREEVSKMLYVGTRADGSKVTNPE